MTVNDPQGGVNSPKPPDEVLRRLSEARWLITLGGVFLLGCVLAGIVDLIAAAVIFAGFVALVAVIRRRDTVPRSMSAPVRTGPTGPDASIRLFAEALPDPCMMLDRRGIVRFANRRAIDAFSIRAGEALTSRLRVPDLIAAFDRVAAGGEAEGVEFAERVPTERWFAAWFARLEAGNQQDGFIALLLDDLTERRRSERIRVDFVANASHELRTPLASLAGFIDTLKGPARNDVDARERFLDIMEEQATRMSRLIDDLLSLSRIEMKAHVRPSGEVDLCAVIRQLGDALEPLAGELGVKIVPSLPDGPVMVVGDRDELTQVFENLIENACKYGQSGGRVDVNVMAASDSAGPGVSVRDYGPGIREEHIPRLTERFYRVDADASRKHRGTGLGLAIVKHILTRHHARMTIESERGAGATFTVVFPQLTVETDSLVEEKV